MTWPRPQRIPANQAKLRQLSRGLGTAASFSPRSSAGQGQGAAMLGKTGGNHLDCGDPAAERPGHQKS
ncbi:MAG TPA: hypothetical protein DDY43_01355 [Synechococcales bacterium UBA10510]|nr:hypothetical protein [Synechococcales bacterium UBA10510]